MSIKFGKDGTIYCNTVKYNYKQARNIIADSNYGSSFGQVGVWQQWIDNTTPPVASTNPSGYKAYRCIKVGGRGQGNDGVYQKLPSMITGHIYYFSYMFNQKRDASDTTFATSVYLGSDYSFKNTIKVDTNGNWVKFSYRKSWEPSATTTQWLSASSGGSVITYLSRFILIDLTDTFGEGNEPTKEWCDNNIREHETYVNYGNVSTTISPTNDVYTFDGFKNVYKFNYLQLDSNWEPRDYMWMLCPSEQSSECFIYSTKTFNLTPSDFYYFQIDANLERKNNLSDFYNRQSCDLYFPIAEPFLQQVPLTNQYDFNGGGGMQAWKRISMYGERSMFSAGSYQMRFDFNNLYYTNNMRVTGLILLKVAQNLTQYNKYNNTNVTIDDINKEWCDRWIDGRNSSIIHIKDPHNTSIKFAKPIPQADTHIRTYTTDELNNIATLKDDYWVSIANISTFKAGDLLYVLCQNSTTNKPVRVVVRFLRAEGSTMYVDSVGWGDEGDYWWNLCEGYDIECNDIEIRPEINKIAFDKTGTIKCKKLVMTQLY